MLEEMSDELKKYHEAKDKMLNDRARLVMDRDRLNHWIEDLDKRLESLERDWPAIT